MFSIATTHFDAGSSSTHRLAQMRQLKQGLEKHQVSVVTGDFNICARGGHSRNEEEYKELVSVLSPYAHVNDASVPTHKIGTLDYVFVHPEHAIAESSKCHVVDSIAKNASDHMALVVEVSLRK
jgi:endonuclease/exonuclease/phosphatase family metal-dependent hydrolase